MSMKLLEQPDWPMQHNRLAFNAFPRTAPHSSKGVPHKQNEIPTANKRAQARAQVLYGSCYTPLRLCNVRVFQLQPPIALTSLKSTTLSLHPVVQFHYLLLVVFISHFDPTEGYGHEVSVLQCTRS